MKIFPDSGRYQSNTLLLTPLGTYRWDPGKTGKSWPGVRILTMVNSPGSVSVVPNRKRKIKYLLYPLWAHFLSLRDNAILLRERGTPPGLECVLLPNTRKWIVRGDTHADKARDLIGKGRPGGEQQGKATQENCFAMGLTVSDIMVMGLVTRLSLANHSDSGPFLVPRASLGQDGFQRKGFWEVGGTCGLASPLSFWPFQNSSPWRWPVSSAFLTRTSCCKRTHVSGYYPAWPGWWFPSVIPVTMLSEMFTVCPCWKLTRYLEVFFLSSWSN